jgi:hypothetical protein
VKTKRIIVQGQPCKKFAIPHLNQKKKKLGVVVRACHPNYMESIKRRSAVQA